MGLYAKTECSPNAFDHPMPCQTTPSCQSRALRGHLCLQLSELFLLVVFFDSGGCLASDLGLRRHGEATDFVAHRDGSCVEHLLVELLLLEFCELLVEIIFVDDGIVNARAKRLGDLVADCVLIAELFPKSSSVSEWLIGHSKSYMVSSTVSMVRPAWMCFMAAPALFMASRVSLLIFALSME